MKLLFPLCLAACTFFSQLNAQVKDAKANLKRDAVIMANATIKKDFKTLAHYTHPDVIKMMGGEEAMITTLEKGMDKLKEGGMVIDSAVMGEPSDIIINNKELEATIGQHVSIKIPGSRISNTSTLIAVSTNNGVSWTFFDPSNGSIDVIRKALHISPDLKIPPKQTPVKYPD